MRAVIYILMFTLLGSVAFAQASSTDTIQGAETVFTSTKVDIKKAGVVHSVFTQIGGTSDGTSTWEASINGDDFVPITSSSGLFKIFPADTLTVTNSSTHMVYVLTPTPYLYLRQKIVGTSGDTTQVKTYWVGQR